MGIAVQLQRVALMYAHNQSAFLSTSHPAIPLSGSSFQQNRHRKKARDPALSPIPLIWPSHCHSPRISNVAVPRSLQILPYPHPGRRTNRTSPWWAGSEINLWAKLITLPRGERSCEVRLAADKASSERLLQYVCH